MRDTTFTLQALHFLNLDWEADEFMQFVADLEPNQDGALQIMYGIDGRRDLTESTREDLSGYAGAKPVRVGNGAFDQRQNDVFGAVLDSILLHVRRSDRLPRRLWPILEHGIDERGCYASTTTRMRWMPPRCWQPSSDSCPETTSGSARACSPLGRVQVAYLWHDSHTIEHDRRSAAARQRSRPAPGQ
jgi:hypothetical protein